MDMRRSGTTRLELHTLGKQYMFTFAILARKRERTRNLNLSSSVCMMTSLKLADGSAVAFIFSMASILTTVLVSRAL